MKEPKTIKGKLKALIEIAKWGSEMKGTEEEQRFVSAIIAGIQNDLGSDEGDKILTSHNLEFNG